MRNRLSPSAGALGPKASSSTWFCLIRDCGRQRRPAARRCARRRPAAGRLELIVQLVRVVHLGQVEKQYGSGAAMARRGGEAAMTTAAVVGSSGGSGSSGSGGEEQEREEREQHERRQGGDGGAGAGGGGRGRAGGGDTAEGEGGPEVETRRRAETGRRVGASIPRSSTTRKTSGASQASPFGPSGGWALRRNASRSRTRSSCRKKTQT